MGFPSGLVGFRLLAFGPDLAASLARSLLGDTPALESHRDASL